MRKNFVFVAEVREIFSRKGFVYHILLSLVQGH